VDGVITGFGIIGFVIATGYVAERTGIVGKNATQVLNRVAYFIANPALLFTVLARADLRDVFSSAVAVELFAVVAVSGLYVVFNALWFKRGVPDATLGAMAASYVNASNIGIPVATYVLGNATYVAPVLLLQLLVISPLALTMLDISAHGKVSVMRILSQPVRNPMIVASALGTIVSATGATLPAAVMSPFTLLGGAAIPLVLLAFGMSLGGSTPLRAQQGRAQILVASALKSVVMPIVAYVVAQNVFGLDGRPLFAAVMMAALPTAQNVYNYASRFNKSITVARDTVFLTTVMAVPALVITATLLS